MIKLVKSDRQNIHDYYFNLQVKSLHANSVFESGDEEFEIFEKEFPYKEKHVTDTQFKKE